MATINRRRFLQGAAATGGALALGGPFQGFTALAANNEPDFRQLREVHDHRDDAIRLHLPEGFEYRSFHDTTQTVTLDDGTILPGRHDGMGAFDAGNGNIWLVRNHEVNNPGTPFGNPALAYDSMAGGGTTTIEVTPDGQVVHAFTSLNGTQMNCAGGVMPWGSWMTVEETVNGPDVGPDFTGVSNIPLTRRHGFIYDVPAGGQSDRQPITKAGRFAHEAVAFDPEEGILYLTEDDFGFPSGFYRYTPATNPMDTGSLDNDGSLQMLAVVGEPNADLAATQRRRATYEVEWVDIEDPDPSFPYTPGQTAPTSNNDAIKYVASQGWTQGAAFFSRLEGCVYDDRVIYFTSTQGGGPAEPGMSDSVQGWGNGNGQIWAYKIDEGILQLIYQSPGPETLDFPDNVTTSPRGTIILCEDNVNDNYIRGLNRGGKLWDIALNRIANRTNDEFAGSIFSPDGGTLFVNIQASRGMTFAIWGPWERIGV